MRTRPDYTLYLVTDRELAGGRPLEWIVERALRGGVTCVQVRDKAAPPRELAGLVRRLLPLARARGAPLLVNDRADVALATGADGVHLGQSDLSPAAARRLLGPGRIVGWSVETPAQARAAEDEPVDYLGVSPIFSTPTKPGLASAWGLEGLRRLRAGVRKPLVAIGGLNRETLPGVARAGADGFAVVSAICAAPDPEAAARELAALIAANRRPEEA